jgi:chromate transporter
VLAIVLEAVIRVGKRALKNMVMVAFAAAAFIALFAFHLPFPLVIMAAAMIGYIGARVGLRPFLTGNGHGKVGGAQVADADTALGEAVPAHARPPISWSVKIGGVFLVLWLVPYSA